MNKPMGYDEAQSYTGDIETLELGGHVCKITDVSVEHTQNGSEYLAIYFDIAEGKQAGFYKRRFDEAVKNGKEAKWQGVYNQFTQGNSTPFFKGMIENIEKSNQGYSFIASNFDEKTLIGKLFGGVFGREQYRSQDGKLKFVTKCRSIRTIEKRREGVEIPEDKLLAEESNNNFFNSNNYTSSDALPF